MVGDKIPQSVSFFDLMVISTQTASKSCISKSVLRLLCILSLVYIRTPPPGRSHLSFLKGDLKLSIISFSFGVSGFSQLSVKTSMSYAIDSHFIMSSLGSMLWTLRCMRLRWLAK